MTDQPPQQRTLGEMLTSAMTAKMIAKAQADYYKTLVERGIEPERAQQMTERAIDVVMKHGAEIIMAFGSAAASLAPIVEQITGLIETPVVETWLNELRG